MTVVRGIRPIAIVLAILLAIVMAVTGSASPSSAAAGEISGQVVDSTHSGLDGLTVIIDDGSDPPYQTVTTSGGGYFTYTQSAAGDYDVVVLGGDDHLDYNSGPISYDPATPTSGELGQIVLDPGKRLTGIVRDAATTLPVEGVIVVAISTTGTGTGAGIYPALPPTGSSGEYSVGVPPGDDYYLVAFDGSFLGGLTASGVSYDPQFWDHINFTALLTSSCGCSSGIPVTPVTVDTTWPGPKITDIDFDLLSYSVWIYFSVLAERLPGPAEYSGLRILLDKWDAGTSSWDLAVASDFTNADGYADLYGFGAGDYRIRYTAGGDAVAVVSYDDYSGGPFPLYDGGESVEFPTLYPTSTGCGCSSSGFEVQELDLLFPAASGGSGGGPTTTHATSHRTVSTVAATPTPTPTPTPTSTPSPSSSPASQPEQSPTPTPQPVPASDTGFPWWIILIIVLAAGIIATVILVLRRR